MPQENMLTAEDKKFILVAVNDAMVELAGATAGLIEGLAQSINEVKKDVAVIKIDVIFLKQQAAHTNRTLGIIRDDLALVHRRVDRLEESWADRVNDAPSEVDLRKK
jgi:hypothetical protein